MSTALPAELRSKVSEAVELIALQVGLHQRPITLSSFGKDSMVLLSLVEKAGLKLPLLSFREPFHRQKYEFADKVIRERDYVVYDYPPVQTMISVWGEEVEILNLHSMPGKLLYLPTGIKPPVAGKPYLCGLVDLYQKPVCSGGYGFPDGGYWDLLLIGHKSSDVDPILGQIPIKSSFVKGETAGFPDLLFPLRHFTDADIWSYTEAEGLPVNDRRYNRDADWEEFEDITYNPDYFHACVECMHPCRLTQVFCPRIQQLVPNLSHRLRHFHSAALKLPAYLAGPKE